MICWNPWACYPHIVLIIYRGSATSGWFDCHNENVSDFKNYSGRRPFWPPWPISFPPHIHTLPTPPPECVISRPTSRDPCDGCLGKSKFMTSTWSFIFVSCLFYLIISFFYLSPFVWFLSLSLSLFFFINFSFNCAFYGGNKLFPSEAFLILIPKLQFLQKSFQFAKLLLGRLKE